MQDVVAAAQLLQFGRPFCDGLYHLVSPVLQITIYCRETIVLPYNISLLYWPLPAVISIATDHEDISDLYSSVRYLKNSGQATSDVVERSESV